MKNLAWRIWLPITVIVIWQGLSSAGVVTPLLLPSPLAVAESVVSLVKNGEIFHHVAVSLVRVFEGFLLAAIVGVALGSAIGLWSTFDRTFDWLLQTLKPIPPIGWFPLAVLWFGIGEVSKVFIIFLGAFFPILVNVVAGIRQTDKQFIELARVYEIGWWKFFTKVIMPGALPSTLTGLRIGIGFAWTCVVAAELIAAESGVGYLIVDARQTFHADVVIVGMLTIGLLGTLMDLALRQIEARLVRWKQPFEGATG
ncbi:ABC transporter permease [Blastopirellula retiformator]|uniref:Putative aliphatic sulfonates transport permease protein SsuC n=1 Tax=Blastopirellula retiformator TaxID=2527970 RepID=A0A5C5V8W7_9BACT|nr:ABC transporter permease [Blastopirellula retiformator]TWT34413.1 putative aliphatic sulfonates transport permease protein SsuC [Blastopirellula retiformator]